MAWGCRFRIGAWLSETRPCWIGHTMQGLAKQQAGMDLVAYDMIQYVFMVHAQTRLLEHRQPFRGGSPPDRTSTGERV